jgi:hypothetical protein
MSSTKWAVASASKDPEGDFDRSTIFGDLLGLRLGTLLKKFQPSESLPTIEVSFLSWLWLSISYFATG